ncbi:hypothetical protein CXG81DRAFT_16784 [Caulochytrium protostelioides]|uniref:Uncharacterized protein n=1 Tax=Caulochytrium protostelioides TaxID=1555241 RepID=A0A4P9XDW4_9FUNG|nr:hypothetical protein CXG81DRAFT_16784 [Caulochytrium protostelioides]|eukprot:RKP03683.1 hypothetical protein CXG81DRAFT_16784 [Caulochytrium protostelioides]
MRLDRPLVAPAAAAAASTGRSARTHRPSRPPGWHLAIALLALLGATIWSASSASLAQATPSSPPLPFAASSAWPPASPAPSAFDPSKARVHIVLPPLPPTYDAPNEELDDDDGGDGFDDDTDDTDVHADKNTYDGHTVRHARVGDLRPLMRVAAEPATPATRASTDGSFLLIQTSFMQDYKSTGDTFDTIQTFRVRISCYDEKSALRPCGRIEIRHTTPQKASRLLFFKKKPTVTYEDLLLVDYETGEINTHRLHSNDTLTQDCDPTQSSFSFAVQSHERMTTARFHVRSEFMETNTWLLVMPDAHIRNVLGSLAEPTVNDPQVETVRKLLGDHGSRFVGKIFKPFADKYSALANGNADQSTPTPPRYRRGRRSFGKVAHVELDRLHDPLHDTTYCPSVTEDFLAHEAMAESAYMAAEDEDDADGLDRAAAQAVLASTPSTGSFTVKHTTPSLLMMALDRWSPTTPSHPIAHIQREPAAEAEVQLAYHHEELARHPVHTMFRRSEAVALSDLSNNEVHERVVFQYTNGTTTEAEVSSIQDAWAVVKSFLLRIGLTIKHLAKALRHQFQWRSIIYTTEMLQMHFRKTFATEVIHDFEYYRTHLDKRFDRFKTTLLDYFDKAIDDSRGIVEKAHDPVDASNMKNAMEHLPVRVTYFADMTHGVPTEKWNHAVNSLLRPEDDIHIKPTNITDKLASELIEGLGRLGNALTFSELSADKMKTSALKVMREAALLTANALPVVMNLLLSVTQQVFAIQDKLMSAHINIPLITNFYEKVLMRGGAKMTVYGMIGMSVAGPVNHLYGLFHGFKTPFYKKDVDFVSKLRWKEYNDDVINADYGCGYNAGLRNRISGVFGIAKSIVTMLKAFYKFKTSQGVPVFLDAMYGSFITATGVSIFKSANVAGRSGWQSKFIEHIDPVTLTLMNYAYWWTPILALIPTHDRVVFRLVNTAISVPTLILDFILDWSFVAYSGPSARHALYADMSSLAIGVFLAVVDYAPHLSKATTRIMAYVEMTQASAYLMSGGLVSTIPGTENHALPDSVDEEAEGVAKAEAKAVSEAEVAVAAFQDKTIAAASTEDDTFAPSETATLIGPSPTPAPFAVSPSESPFKPYTS